ncbi:hypothetical protein BDM02DRAFT_3109044, partial [Thelephora ganbajun]
VLSVYDIKLVKVPLLSKHFIEDKAIVAASWIGFLDFVSVISPQSRDLPSMPSTFEHPRFPAVAI